MSATKSVTIWLEQEDYERFTAEAERRATQLDELALSFVRAALGESAETDAERRRRGLEVLEKRRALRQELRDAGYPPIDAVKIVQEGREELEQRPYLP